VVRLAAHDAMDGVTDGCVLLHEPANGGLAATAAALDSLFVAWRQRLPQLSRADFWQVLSIGLALYNRSHHSLVNSGQSFNRGYARER
jgi:hypothetical protein